MNKTPLRLCYVVGNGEPIKTSSEMDFSDPNNQAWLWSIIRRSRVDMIFFFTVETTDIWD